MPAGRPRTAIPEKEELIELGKDLVKWASEQIDNTQSIRVRYCDWYTDRGFIRKQWEHMREKTEFQWYYEKARSFLSLRYIDGTVNQSIAHRYLRMYDPELRDQEDSDERFKASLKTEVNSDDKALDAISKVMDYVAKAQSDKSDLTNSNTDKMS